MSRMERTPTRLRGCPPLGLVGALILVAAVEAAIDRRPLATLSGTQWGYRTATQAAGGAARDCQVLCFGDSLLKLGLAPKVLAAESGLRAYNLAVQGGQAAGSYFLLRRALAAGARPRAIVVDFFPSMLATTPHFNDENLPILVDLPAALDLATTLGEPAEFARLAVAHLLPSVRSRTALRAQVGFALAGSSATPPIELLRALRNWRANRGAEITAPRPMAYDLDAWERAQFGPFACLPAHRIYVDRFLDLAAQHQVPVFWALPPYRGELQGRCDRSGFDAAHEEFVRSAQARHENLVVVDARRAGYDPDVFVDWHHLGRAGAAVFSAEVGRAIRDHLCDPASQTRWVTLPPFRPRPEPAPLEDGEQSRTVVWRHYLQNAERAAVR